MGTGFAGVSVIDFDCAIRFSDCPILDKISSRLPLEDPIEIGLQCSLIFSHGFGYYIRFLFEKFIGNLV